MTSRPKLRTRDLFITGITLLIAIAWAYPIFYIFNPWTILISLFESFGDILKTVRSQEFLESLEFRWYLNSMGVSSVVTLLTIVLCAPCAYAVSRLEFPGKNILFWFLMAGVIIPKEILFVPMFMDLASVRLANHYIGIALPQVVAPIIILAFKYYFDQVPTELREAAYMDGASEWRILWTVYIPINRLITIVLAIYVFITAWNNFFWPFTLKN
jgi:multiple sugar transport system permease protein